MTMSAPISRSACCRPSRHAATARARLVQADGLRLPFGDAAFDAVMLVQVFGGMSAWQAFAGEVRRVLRTPGVVLIGRTATPEDGVDARMKRQLGVILGEGGGRGGKARENVEHLLGASAARVERRVVASWSAQRTPRQFIARHRTGARFSALPDAVKDDAMRKLGAWAETNVRLARCRVIRDPFVRTACVQV